MKFNNIVYDSHIIENKSSINSRDSLKESKVVVLQPVGYPFSCNLIDTPKIEVFDKQLFEIYAREQWEGFNAVEGSFLFDQKILPDFAFKVIKAHPDNSKITSSTSIILIDNQEINEIKNMETDIKMEDVIGQKQAKLKCKIIQKYLKDPEHFKGWAPRNVLFYGTPGTGKTMLAKSLSGELKVPLYLIKATSLIGDHVGDGSRQIHDLYDLASKTSPSVIFIDEIDAIALDRKFQSLRGDVSEVVNALLTEMDGIKDNLGVVTIGATNNPSLLDYAIRSRFEEEIEFKLPDENERREMIEKYIESMPLEVKVSRTKLAQSSKGMSGRDIKEKLLKTALHKAISEDKSTVDREDIEYALKNYQTEKNEPKNMFA
ncbi:AAA family ATPase [Methanobacterium alkalithermotolerans]|uniref:AAA family ATPase n=1 Tax=Methanobacterium alkalithermotolerans TaxID=2731220 RepID=A0A8T8K5F0_9EURY|nr:AAA family ATPase [Methanobacterium alkalithermotolerans]QUH23072.1 AAA family ATPase [Methanobacterium alkalithermotolerans]RJS48078.1 MAG: AAA family ATPase [Methanobacterium sp.]